MLIMTTKGLFCPAGNFYIDPKRAVENAVITHAHSDHARKGSQHYFCTSTGVSLLKARLGQAISVTAIPYGKTFSLGNVTLSFHPAGHILGSAQVRIEAFGEVWVVSGDYKREADKTCEPFEPIKCDVFITEATFGTPSFVWNNTSDSGKEIVDWWMANAKQKTNSVIYAYSLGKAQRVLNLLAPYAKKPIYCDAATHIINDCYRAQNIVLADTHCLSNLNETARLSGDLLIVPPGFLQSPKACILGNRFRTAFASGWMAKETRGFHKGFLISDHADWNDLIKTILETEAKKIYVQHRGKGALVRKLNAMGLQAYSDAALYPDNPDQLALF